MKRRVSFWLFLVLMLTLTGCGQKEPALKVQLRRGEETVFQAVYADGKCKKTEPFQPDAGAHYEADFGDFQAQVVEGKVVNTLSSHWLTDEQGNSFWAEDTLAQLLQAAADTIDHDIRAFDIWVVGQRYFAFAQLNVNWSDPGVLYEYAPKEQSLTELASWDKAELTGIALQ